MVREIGSRLNEPLKCLSEQRLNLVLSLSRLNFSLSRSSFLSIVILLSSTKLGFLLGDLSGSRRDCYREKEKEMADASVNDQRKRWTRREIRRLTSNSSWSSSRCSLESFEPSEDSSEIGDGSGDGAVGEGSRTRHEALVSRGGEEVVDCSNRGRDQTRGVLSS